MHLVLAALEHGDLTDPQLVRETDLGMFRMYGALRTLRSTGVIRATRDGWFHSRYWRTVRDEPEVWEFEFVEDEVEVHGGE